MIVADKGYFSRNSKARVYAPLIACVMSASVDAGQVGHYRMDNLLNMNNNLGEFFTFSVDDKNGDGLATSDEIFNFSGIECPACATIYGDQLTSSITTLGRVDKDLLFGGSGEAIFNLTTLDWTYTITGANEAPVNRTLNTDFGWSDASGNGTPLRQYGLGGTVQVWSAIVVSDAGEPLVTQESFDLAQQMYVAYYGRAGDPGGVNYWAEEFTKSNNLDTVLAEFGNSDEFSSSFGFLQQEQLINGLFQQMFNRDSDPDGLAFYVDRLDTGKATLASIAKQIADGAVDSDLESLNNKIGVANSFTTRVEEEGFIYDGDDIGGVQVLLKAVNSEFASLGEGLEAVTNWLVD